MSLLNTYAQEAENELLAILDYWQSHTVDNVHGGFLGRIDQHDQPWPTAPKGSVLCARILWTFSAAYRYGPNPEYLVMAERAYNYLLNHFIDPVHGGVYWSVTCEGKPLDTKKQIYALSFAIYGLTEYYRACGSAKALHTAIALFNAIEAHSFDAQKGGYLEAFARDWAAIDDLRLSDKDANEKKTTNTHLHVLEGYTNLYRVWQDDTLKERLQHLIDLFLTRIIDPVSHQQILFFDEDWQPRSDLVSFGHDIEAFWLLLEAGKVLNDSDLLDRVEKEALPLARAAASGLDCDGGLWYEMERSTNHWLHEKHWWVQAEAMVGFLKAFQLTHETHFLDKSLKCWEFVKKHIIDHTHGEWRWAVMADYSPMPGQDKAGFWKCPYHNSRACLQIIGLAASLG